LSRTAAVPLCVECDAPPGECAHLAGRYLDAIVYEKATQGWLVSDVERPRWDAPVLGVIRNKPTDRQPTPLPELVVGLEGHMDLDSRMEALLRSAYELEPLKVTFVVERTLGADLRSPGGYLYKRLGEISASNGNGAH
jgi:hypothetical protein